MVRMARGNAGGTHTPGIGQAARLALAPRLDDVRHARLTISAGSTSGPTTGRPAATTPIPISTGACALQRTRRHEVYRVLRHAPRAEGRHAGANPTRGSKKTAAPPPSPGATQHCPRGASPRPGTHTPSRTCGSKAAQQSIGGVHCSGPGGPGNPGSGLVSTVRGALEFLGKKCVAKNAGLF